MDTKEAYRQLIQALKQQLDAEMPLAKEADDTLVAKGLLSSPAEAFALFTVPVDGYVDRIAEEIASPSHNGHRRLYCSRFHEAAQARNLQLLPEPQLAPDQAPLRHRLDRKVRPPYDFLSFRVII